MNKRLWSIHCPIQPLLLLPLFALAPQAIPPPYPMQALDQVMSGRLQTEQLLQAKAPIVLFTQLAHQVL